MKREEALEIVRNFCEASVFGDMGMVSATLHEKVVFVAPDLSSTLVGKDACMQSINQYHKEAKTLAFKIKDLVITQDHRDLITRVKYEVTYTYLGQRHHEQGDEIIILTEADNSWSIIWRGIIKLSPLT